MKTILKYKYIFITIIICIFLILLSSLYAYYYQNSIKYTDIKNVNIIHDLLQQIDCEFKKNGVDYIIIGGTLLGSVRQNGHTPYDDDGDICVLNKTAKEIEIILRPLKEKFNIDSFEHHRGNIVLVKYPDNPTCIDIFFMKKGRDNLYRFLPPFDEQYPEYFTEDEIYPIKDDYTFGPLILSGPNEANSYLHRTYPNWNTTAHIWNHNMKHSIKQQQTEFKPVLPNEDFIIRKCLI